MDAHDIDDPAEVVAAADRYHAAMTEVTDRAAEMVRALAQPRRAASSLDRELESRLEWVTATLGRAVSRAAAQSAATHRTAIDAVRALVDADHAGAERIRDAGPD